jgi:hypothetical protein
MTVRVAAIQMVSRPAVQDNLRDARALIAAAAAQGAELVALPEYFCLMGLQETDKLAVREPDGDGPVQQFLAAQARTHGIWLVGGTAPLADPAGERVRNSVLVYATTRFTYLPFPAARSPTTRRAPSPPAARSSPSTCRRTMAASIGSACPSATTCAFRSCTVPWGSRT